MGDIAAGTREPRPPYDELFAWAGEVAGGRVVRSHQISGGNRCHSWTLDIARPDGTVTGLYLRYQPPRPPSVEPYTVRREASVYRALQGSAVPAAPLVAVHPVHQAILAGQVPGRAEFRRIGDDAARTAIAREFVQALAELHRLPADRLREAGLAPAASIAGCVRAELATWQAMYAETGRSDALIDLALDWLGRHVPDPAGPPVLVHGDAGPGNFLYEDGRLTALVDWELAHPGDPMEDLAWFSMRSVMEPVPDFAERIREYESFSGAPADLARIRYHRVFVSTRVVIIRHRNVSGQPGNSIVSQALNRRLLVAALADASGFTLGAEPALEAGPTARTPLYDAVIADMRHEIADRTAEAPVVAAAKNAAKVMKYLRDVDRLGAPVAARQAEALGRLLGTPPADLAAGEADLLRRQQAGAVSFEAVVRYFATRTALDNQLAASASGGLAGRTFPALPQDTPAHA